MTEKTRSIIKDALIHVIERKAKNKYYNPTTLEEYLAILRRHDWFYYQSDMNLSSVPSDELLKLAVDGPHSWKMAYNSVHAEHFYNETFYPAGVLPGMQDMDWHRPSDVVLTPDDIAADIGTLEVVKLELFRTESDHD